MPRFTTVVADRTIPDLDLQAEALHASECIAALLFAREQYALIRSPLNQLGAGIVLLKTTNTLTQMARDAEYDRRKADKLIEAYRVEAIGMAMKQALRLPATKHVERMNRITAVETSRAEERARQAQRSTEAAAYAARKVSRSKATEAAAKAAKAAREATGNQRVQAFKVSDEALIAELRAGRYESVSALAHKIGLAVPTVHTRVNRLVSTGAISREDVPQYRKGGR